VNSWGINSVCCSEDIILTRTSGREIGNRVSWCCDYVAEPIGFVSEDWHKTTLEISAPANVAEARGLPNDKFLLSDTKREF
jgi:hypothetical protein